MDLKQISPESVPRALELAEHYRLLNEPEQAESICKDVLAIDADNQLALRILLLALSDQFGRRQSTGVHHAQEVAILLADEYERSYYSGILMERWARCKMQENQSVNLVYDWLHRAMDAFESAERVRPAGNDAALLRWNTCARLLAKLPKREEAVHSADYGD
jgi:hypothetical protein